MWYFTLVGWRKKKNMIISTDAENTLDKIQQPFVTKTLQKVGAEGTHLSITKAFAFLLPVHRMHLPWPLTRLVALCHTGHPQCHILRDFPNHCAWHGAAPLSQGILTTRSWCMSYITLGALRTMSLSTACLPQLEGKLHEERDVGNLLQHHISTLTTGPK